MSLPVEIYSVASVRRIDDVAINDAGIGGYTLMCRAGAAAVEVAVAEFPDASRWQVVCGAGNNAGDGYVVARLAAERGIDVSVIAVTSPERLTGDAAQAYADFVAAGRALSPFDGTLDAAADLLIDALLGSGLGRDVEGDFAKALAAINDHPSPVVALDLPSGLHGDTGAVMGSAVRADVTVTFVGLKRGLFVGEAADFVGRLHFAGLDIPRACRAGETPVLQRIDDAFIANALPRRSRTAHKGTFGHVLVIGGGPGMPGAVRLAGEAALRSGAGLVSIATHPSHGLLPASGRPELMCHGIADAADLDALFRRATVLAVGPGLGTDAWARDMFEAALGSGLPLVVDADALNLLAEDNRRSDDWILTPHPGEAARLLDQSTDAIQRDRVAAVEALAARFGGTAVLKGSGTLVSCAAGPPWFCTGGNPGMASPGMGDVLTGIIAGFRAQGLSGEIAAVAGVEAHARAGDRAAADGERGIIASDLLEALKPVINC